MISIRIGSSGLVVDNVTVSVTKCHDCRSCAQCGEIRDRDDMIRCAICDQFICSSPGVQHLYGCPVDTSETRN